jgi:KDO2-lipid IV(A) lauroyltransferase
MANKLGTFGLRQARRYFSQKTPEQGERVGERLGSLFYRLSSKHRERALQNLSLAMPEMTPSERRQLSHNVFLHFGRVASDFLSGRLADHQSVRNSTTAEGLEHLDAALREGKGVILITGHFGNWERLAAFLNATGYRLSVVARDANQGETTTIVNSLRESAGTAVIPRGNAVRPIIERLRRNELIGILPDQNSDEAFIPFFGKPCGTVLGPGVIASRTGSPVMCCWCVWIGPGRYHVIIEPPLEAAAADVPGEGMARSINLALEHIIRRYPEQWLWFHNRWKSAIKRGLI